MAEKLQITIGDGGHVEENRASAKFAGHELPGVSEIDVNVVASGLSMVTIKLFAKDCDIQQYRNTP